MERAECLAGNVGDVGGMKGDPASRFAASDWHIAKTSRLPVLIIGAADALEQALAALVPYLEPPVCCWTPDTQLPSPGDVKTLVIHNVDTLSAERQRDLISWMEQEAVAPARIVSTTTVPIFQRVAAGLFLDDLYYRLNAVVLNGGDSWSRMLTATTSREGRRRTPEHIR